MSKRKKGKYSFINEIYDAIVNCADVAKNGKIRIKRADVRTCIEKAFVEGAKKAASGERIRFPIIGALVRKDVKPRKAGKGVNPFTGEAIMVKARPASKKPRWSFPRSLKETFADRKNW